MGDPALGTQGIEPANLTALLEQCLDPLGGAFDVERTRARPGAEPEPRISLITFSTA